MGFFSKDKNKSKLNNEMSQNITLPELPPLPPFEQIQVKNVAKNSSDLNMQSFKIDIPPKKANPQISSLPSLPKSSIATKLNQSIIKDNIVSANESEHEEEYSQSQDSSPVTNNQNSQNNQYDQNVISQGAIPQISPEMMPSQYPHASSRAMEISNSNLPLNKPAIPIQQVPRQTIKQKEPLFIKLDKVESTIANLNEIKLRISEIESLLRNIKEVKMKEEHEIREWEREVQTVKVRLDQIDKDLFKEID